MSEYQKVIGTYTDKYGKDRTVRRDKGGTLRIAREGPSVVLTLNAAAAELTGLLIREHREQVGLTLEALCIKSGLVSTYPKSRMWEIEKGTREGNGIRLGTLYALAHALGISPCRLLPTSDEVFAKAGVGLISSPPKLAVRAEAAE